MQLAPSSSRWQIFVLGGVRVVDDKGNDVDPGPRKCQELLGALALCTDRSVSVEALVDQLWGQDPPRTAAKTLQSHIARLRRVLGHDQVLRVEGAYRLAVSDEDIDVRRFRRAVALGDIDEALSEWGGTPLAGLDAVGLRPAVDGLIEEWLSAVELAMEDAVTTDPQLAIGRLTELTSLHPFREGLWALLMQALHQVGRQADALAAFQRARTHLVEELGVEPGQALQDLERQILTLNGDTPLRETQRGIPGPPPDGTVTFVYAELLGITSLWSNDRDVARRVVARLEEILTAAALEHGGYLVVSGVDTSLYVFHRVAEALSYASEVQEAIVEESWLTDNEIGLRIGIHTGDAEERAGSYYGPAPQIATQIASASHPGQTVVSAGSAGLVTGFNLTLIGSVVVDAQLVPLYQMGAGSYPPPRTSEAHGNLPRWTTPLIGREELVNQVTRILGSSRLVTLVGPGGIGKTRIALEVARSIAASAADGAWIADLSEAASSDDVVRTVMDMLGVAEVAGRPPAETLVSALADRQILLVLDNCEHVIDGAAALAAALVERGRDTRVIATSREGLGISIEQIVVVGPLDVSGAATELFEQRAAAVDQSFRIEEWRESVQGICRRLDGVPLAIELAAAQVQSSTPTELLARLDESFGLLSGGRRRSVERHRTLRATIQWSYDLLTISEQTAFARLAIFAGSFDLAAAEHVAAGNGLEMDDVSPALSDLVARSMVLSEPGPHGRRFRLLEMMRQFGLDQLAATANTEATANRHVEFVATEVQRISELLHSRSELAGAAQLEELWPNVRAAFEWAIDREDLTHATLIVASLAPQAFLRRGFSELSDWAGEIATVAALDDPDLCARGLLWCALPYILTKSSERFAAVDERLHHPDHALVDFARALVEDDSERIVRYSERAIAEANRLSDDHAGELVEIITGGALLGLGHLPEAEDRLTAVTGRLRLSGPPTYLSWTLFMLGSLAELKGEVDTAQRCFDEALSLSLPPQTNSGHAILEARSAFRSGDRTHAFHILGQFVDDELTAGHSAGAGFATIEFINMAVATGRLEHAGSLAGYLDHSGLLELDSPGFGVLVEAALKEIEQNAAALAARQQAGKTGPTPVWALRRIRQHLTEYLIAEPEIDGLRNK